MQTWAKSGDAEMCSSLAHWIFICYSFQFFGHNLRFCISHKAPYSRLTFSTLSHLESPPKSLFRANLRIKE